MAIDPTTQKVYITGVSSSDLPDWATEQSQERIVEAIKAGSANVYKATTVNANIGANMSALLGQLVMIMKGDKKSAINYTKMIQEQAEVRKQLAELKNGIKTVADNTDPGKASTTSPNPKPTVGETKIEGQLRKLNKYEEMMLRKELASAKDDKEQNSILKDMVRKLDTSNSKLEDNKSLLTKLGITDKAATGNDTFGTLMALAGGPEVAMAMQAITTAYTASQIPFEMMMQQVKDRFEIGTELRQSGLLEDMSASFLDVTKSFSDNNMTIVEATQFVREFSKSVGVMGTGAALKFVNQMAYSTDMMSRFGLNFSQVAKISGTYLDTLERTGMLEQISTSERDRGMKSFMSAVEGVSMTLKTSLEESAKMISEYLSRDDISAMLMTSSTQLSQEVITQIGAMAKMGPLGEIIAKGAIDPNRFMLTPEFQKLNNPALAGVRGIIEQMMSDLRSGKGTDELIAQYGKRMSDIIKNDPVVGQLAAMDTDVQSIISGVGRLAQTSQDAITNIVPPQVDQAERRRQDQARKLSVSYDRMAANALKTLENTGRMTEILNAQTDILSAQTNAVNNIADSAQIIATLLSVSATTNETVMGSISKVAEYVTSLLPKNTTDLGKAGGANGYSTKDVASAAGDLVTTLSNKQPDIDEKIKSDPTKGQTVVKAVEDAVDNSMGWFGGYDDALKAISDIKSGGITLTDANGKPIVIDDTMKSYLDEKTKYYEALQTKNQVSTGNATAGTDLTPSIYGEKVIQPEWGASVPYEKLLGMIMGVDSRTDIERWQDTLKNPSASPEDITSAKEGIRAKAEEYVNPKMMSNISTLSQDNNITESDAMSISNQVKELMDYTGSSVSDMKTFVDTMSKSQEFLTAVGDNADKVIAAMNAPLGETPVVNATQPTIVTAPIIQSFLDTMDPTKTAGATNVEGSTTELYGKMAELTGGSGTDFGDVQMEAFDKFITDMEARDNISADKMKAMLNEVIANITTNQTKLVEATGDTDVTKLLGAIKDLITRLQ
jgi:hypothetical protein